MQGTTSEISPNIGSEQTHNNKLADRLLVVGAWMIAISMVLLVGYLGFWNRNPFNRNLPAFGLVAATQEVDSDANLSQPTSQTQLQSALVTIPLPESMPTAFIQAIRRYINPYTIIPTRPREDVITYTVDTGDSVFGIAKDFNIKPETVLWANYNLLKDSPDMLSPGMDLKIPPVNGVLHEWKEGDTLKGVAGEYKANIDDILNWPGNKLDLTNPQVQPGEYVMVVDGEREFVQWVIPTIPRGRAGVSRSVYGPGACDGGYDGAYGSGTFIWPSGNHFLSGNDYWSGHLGIDIAGATGDAVLASDSGVVVFAGGATGGYGYMVMIDHGNGYQSLYAHMSQVSAVCGQSVGQGQYIGAVGNTGNSTGSHLHFEVRYVGGFVSPWYVLPPP